jgi:hypothetical protein
MSGRWNPACVGSGRERSGCGAWGFSVACVSVASLGVYLLVCLSPPPSFAHFFFLVLFVFAGVFLPLGSFYYVSLFIVL